MSEGQSAIEYLMTYGWMILVVAIVGGAIFMTVEENTLESEDLNVSEVEEVIEDNSRYNECDAELTSYGEDKASVECFRELDEVGNVSYKGGNSYTAELRNGSVYFLPSH